MKSLAHNFTGLILTLSFSLLLLPPAASNARAADETNGAAQLPMPLVPGAKVMALWPAGSPTLKNTDQQEWMDYYKTNANYIQRVTNINNPSIEAHLAPADKANGTAIIVAPGGGNKELWVGPEGVEVATWLNSIGTSAFVLRYRLQPYKSAEEALADTERSVRMVRANAKEWGIDPSKIGVMGFSAGGEQAAWLALRFDAGNPDAADPIEKESDRPDFAVLVYPGWRRMDLSSVPTNAPPVFITCAGIDDMFHARQSVQFYSAWFEAKRPAEIHIYGHGGHGGSIKPRKGIPFGTWQDRFVDWAADSGFMKR